MLETWYLHIEGRCTGNEQVSEPFGFFVHALVACASSTDAKRIVKAELEADGLGIHEYRWCGRFGSFSWDDAKLRSEMTELVREAELRPGEPAFSDFQSWLIGDERDEGEDV